MHVDFSDLENLPKDTGGVQTPFIKGATGAPYGFCLYLPAGYQASGPEFPLLVFLHGAGEKGDSEANPDVLNLLLAYGPPKLIEKKQWHPTYPLIVASPQSEEPWEKNKLHEFIRFVIDNYRINKGRIYVTGVSMGGYGTFRYAAMGKESFASAVVPICGGGNTADAGKIADLPVWAFHGLADHIVPASHSVTMINAINAKGPSVKAKLTMYPGVKHDSWTMTYDGSGMGKESKEYDAFDMNIYDWMFRYKREMLE